MTSAATLIQRASRLLSDQEDGHSYTSWSASDLLDYMNEALCTLYQLRPTEFTKCVELELGPGSKQVLPDGCGTLLSIDSNTADPASGESVGSAITMSASDMVKGLGGKRTCANADNCMPFEIQSYRMHPTSSNIFYVEPPVPPGQTVTVDATVSKPPTGLNACTATCDIPLDCGFDAAVVDWMLMRAYAEDTESQYAANKSRYHQASFWDLVNGGYIADARVRSGGILGQKPNHDHSNGWRHDTRQFGR